MRDGIVLSPGEARALDLTLPREAIALDAVEVLATRAVERQTPVAFTDVDKVQIQQQLGSRDLPMVLNTTPSVYATMQGGGSGDARINIRGFDQRNTAVMINGVPVNDMENGWVYWSNWGRAGGCREQHPGPARAGGREPGHAFHRRHAERHHRPHRDRAGAGLQAGVRQPRLPEGDPHGQHRQRRQIRLYRERRPQAGGRLLQHQRRPRHLDRRLGPTTARPLS